MRCSPRRWLPTAYRFVLICALALTFSAATALAQADATSANLSGVVHDPAGAVVPGATVTVRNPATNDVRTATTNDDGFYQLVQLTPGTYEVTVDGLLEVRGPGREPVQPQNFQGRGARRSEGRRRRPTTRPAHARNLRGDGRGRELQEGRRPLHH